MVNCAICGIRKPKRQCPAVQGQICSVCCATEREKTLDCPLDCEYLKEAHKHEKPVALDPAALPNQDIEIPEEFLQQNEWLLVLLGSALVDGVLKSPGMTDLQVRGELEKLIAAYRNPAGADTVEGPVGETVQARIADIRTRLAAMKPETSEEAEIPPMTIPDATLLSVMVFLQRLEYSHNNGRPLSRAFIHFLQQFHVPGLPAEETMEPEGQQVIS